VAAQAILAVHLAVIAFNVFGLFAIPLGAWRGWSFVRAPTWRWLHLASFAVVAAQAVAGRACFLTVWQDALTGHAESTPLVMAWVNHLIFWPLPAWVFAALYLALFAYVLALLRLIPPRPFRLSPPFGGSTGEAGEEGRGEARRRPSPTPPPPLRGPPPPAGEEK
jgi:hypothetical protein